MGLDDPILGIPAIRDNPFQARPLESGQSDLLVGRGEISGRWIRFLNQKNARMVLLVGESGSGRTSLMRCVSEESGKHVHLDMFPSTNHVRSILEEIHVSLVDFDIPSSNQELVGRLVNATNNADGPLALISLDFSSADGKLLSEVTSSLISALERLEALVVITLTTDQRVQWPETLIQKFDHLEVLHPLSGEEVKELCESRMATVSRTGWVVPEDVIDHLLEKTSGMPMRVMRTMRDMVDYERSNPRDVKFENDSSNIIEESHEEEIVDTMESQSNDEETDNDNQFDFDLEVLEKEPPGITVSSNEIRVRGPFGGLASRNRTYARKNPKPNFTSHNQAEVSGPQNELWMAEGSEPAIVQQISETYDEPVFVPEEVEIDEDPIKEINTNEVEDFLNQLKKVASLPQGMTLADLLSAMRRPIIGNKSSNALDVQTLRNLSKSEAVIVEVSSERELSPSDNRLQDRLGIKRPRMSQICNRLYRAGILSVQQKGRIRFFKLTNDAKAQLVAWGMMEVTV